MIRIDSSGVPTEGLSRSKEVEAAFDGFTCESYVILDNIVPQDTIHSLHEEFLARYRDQIRDRAPRIAGSLGVDPAVRCHGREWLHVPASRRHLARDFRRHRYRHAAVATRRSRGPAGRDCPAGRSRRDDRLARQNPPSGRAPLPSFRPRLFEITKALREYTRFEPLLLRYLPLAERIFAETSDASAAVSNPPPAS